MDSALNDVLDHLAQAPETQIDAQMRVRFLKMKNRPKAEILPEFDQIIGECSHASLASGWALNLLKIIRDDIAKDAGGPPHERRRGYPLK